MLDTHNERFLSSEEKTFLAETRETLQQLLHRSSCYDVDRVVGVQLRNLLVMIYRIERAGYYYADAPSTTSG